MKFQIKEQAAIVLKKQKKHRIYITAVSMACVLTIFGVVYGLTRPGRAFSSLEKTLDCHVMDEVHQHTAECYDEDGNLICGIADFVAHEHDPETCYDEEGNLVCTLPEIPVHIHDDSCYLDRLVLACGIEEGQVIDPSGKPVFDAYGNPVFEFENIPESILLAFNGGSQNNEAAPAEEAPAPVEEAAPAPEAPVEEPAAPVEEAPTEEPAAPVEEPAAPVEEAPTEEPAAPAEEPAAPAEELITENVEMNQGAAPEDLYKGFTKHVHTSECYKVEKELTCTIPGIHVHTQDCYDENGNLICGQLQLSVHVHNDDCYTYTEKQTVVTATAGDYIITASYGPSAKIPEKAEFRVEIIEPETDTYSENEEVMKSSEGEDAEAQVMFNIGFYVDGEEIEPQGSVDIIFQLSSEEYASGDDITILHVKDGGDVDVNQTVIDDENSASITTDSFSIYIILNNGERPGFQPGKYGQYNIELNETKDAFRNSSAYDAYKINSNELGLAANFHIVAFDTFTTASHVNGNVCAKFAYGNNNFGTNNLPNELSYIQYYMKPNSNSGTGQANCMLVLGSYNEIKITGNKNNGENGDEVNIKNLTDNTFVKLDNPKKVLIDKDTGKNPFIDLDKLKLEIQGVRDTLKGYKDQNIEYKFVGTDNGSYIKLTNPDVAGYFNTTAAIINTVSNVNVKMDGFQKGKNGSIIVNVDCTGVKRVDLPKTADIYVDGNAQSTSEVTTFENGKIIWNFYNCDGVEIHTYKMTGIIIAPEAYVVAEGNLNGQIIANKVLCNGETHRVGFTGTTLPVTADIIFGKTVDGKVPADNQVFNFSIYERVGGTWKKLETKQNVGNQIVFSNLSYGQQSDLGTHWYKVAEDESDDTSFVYDKTEYLMKVVVTYDAVARQYKAEKTYYELPNGDSDITFTNGDISGVKTSTVNKEDLKFDNTPNLIEISVKKIWRDYKGDDLATTKLPAKGIDVYLFRTTDDTIDVTGITFDSESKPVLPEGVEQIGEKINLNKDNLWGYKWTKLEKKSKDNKPYVYFVKEVPTEGYEVTYSKNTWFVDGIQDITNREIPEETFIEVEKKFYAFDIDGNKVELTDLEKSNIGKDDYITVVLERSTDGTNFAPYIGTATIKGEEVTFDGSEFKITAADKWKIKIENLPSATVDNNGVVTEYTYRIREIEISNKAYIKDGEDNVEVVEREDKATKKKYKVFIIKNVLKPTELEIDKTWLAYTGSVEEIQKTQDSPVTITISLLQNGKEVGKYVIGSKTAIKADATALYEIEPVMVNDTEHKLWSAKFTKLPAYYVVTESGKTHLEACTYSVTEDKIDGLDGYALVTEAITDPDGQQIVSVLEASLNTDGTYNNIVLYNKSNVTFELPETGSGKLIPMYIVGALITLASGALLIYRKKLRNN